MEPRLLPRFPAGMHQLTPPWRWWRHKLRPCPDGSMYHQHVDPPARPGAPGVEHYCIQFDLLTDYDIVNPPSMFLTTIGPEIDTLYGDRTLMTRGPTTECDVVWHERPGDLWHELPGNTCHPGEYEIRTVDRANRDYNTASTARRYESGMPALYWRSTVLDVDVSEDTVRAIAAAYGVPPALIGGTDLGDPSRVPAAAMPGPRFEDQLSQIMAATREYEAGHMRRPAAVIMNQEDWEQLRRDALRQERDWLMYGRANAGNPFDTIFGLQIRAERNMPRGRILVVGESDIWDTEFRVRPSPYIPPSLFVGLIGPAGPTVASRRDVLPEAELVDEIDRLVNEQVKVGPVDDYRVDRYPRCPHCAHSWHGILCNECDCLGELEEEV